ncbi:MAG: Trk system potassium transporter TrkA [Bacteroidota bacterium]|nr:MAG: Trk system potassium transporter TrkA [Bacteroidota bacterium]
MKIVIAGAGAVGSHLAKMLSEEKHDIILLDPDEAKLRQVGSNLDVMTRTGSAISIPDLLDTNIKKVDLFISVAKTEEINITAAILSKRLGAKKTIARIDNQEYLYAKYRDHFVEMGIDYMIYPEKIAAREIIGLLEQTGSKDIADFSKGMLALFAIKLEEDSPVIGKSLSRIMKETKTDDYRAVAVTRSGKTIIPNGNHVFEAGDLVYVISTEKDNNDLLAYAGKEQYEVRDIMILGGSKIGALAAHELGSHHNVKLIEKDREKSYTLSNQLNNTLVINGDGRDYNLLMEEGLNKMDAFIAVTGDSEVNILAAMLAKRLGVKKTIAEVENIEYIALAENMGIDTIINKKIITASRIFRFTTSENVTAVRCLTGTDAEVLEFMVPIGAKITQSILQKVDFPKDCIIGGIIRDDKSFIGKGSTQLQEGDKVIVFAMPSAISKAAKFFS